MKKIYSLLLFFTFLFLLTPFTPVFGQFIYNTPRSSSHIFIYKIDDKIADELITKISLSENIDTFFKPNQHLIFVDSVVYSKKENYYWRNSFNPINTIEKKLAYGYYLFFWTVENVLHSQFITVAPITPVLQQNLDKTWLVLYDSTSKILDSNQEKLSIQLVNKTLSYNSQLKGYEIKRNLYKRKKAKYATINYEGKMWYFLVHDNYRKSSFLKKLVYKAPLRHFWLTPKNWGINFYEAIDDMEYDRSAIVKRALLWFGGEDFREEIPYKVQGTAIFDKNKYRPADTVRVKLFLLKKNGKAFSKKNIDVEIGRKNIKLGKLNQYRKGGYTFEFVLHDSLDLKLDSYQSLDLTHKKRPIWVREDVTSDEYNDYDEISFRYEDYNLPQIKTFEVKTETTHKRNKPFSVRISAKDANDLSLLDANVEVIVLPKTIKKIFTPSFTIKDTIFYSTQKLDAFGETVIILPDSLFKDLKASFDYTLSVKVVNSNFETREEKKTIFYDYESEKPVFISKFENGKVMAFLLKNEIENGTEKNDTLKREGTLKIYSKNQYSLHNSYTERKISFPFEENASLTAEKYVFEILENEQNEENIIENLQTTLILPSKTDLPIEHIFTDDSLFVTLKNEWQNEIYYTFYKGGRKISKGISKEKELYFDVPAKYRNRFYLTINATQQGKRILVSKLFRRDKSVLTLQTSLKNKVIPAQKDTITISVKDYKNRPVKNTDVTVVATNGQFTSDHTPTVIVPSKLQRYRGLKYKRNYDEINKINRPNQNDTLLYFWKHSTKNDWKLDSIPYYKLIYPKKEGSRFAIRDFDTTSIARFYPIFYKKGIPLKMYYLKMDDSLVNINLYKIETDNKKHAYQIRLEGYLLNIDTLSFEEGKQTIISFDIENLPNYIQAKKMQLYGLLQEESEMIDNHIQWIRFPSFISDSRLFTREDFYVEQGNFRTIPTSDKGYQLIFPLDSSSFNKGKFIVRNRIKDISDTLLFNPKIRYDLKYRDSSIFEPTSSSHYYYSLSNENKKQDLETFLLNYPREVYQNQRREIKQKQPCDCENEQIKVLETDLGKEWNTLVLIENSTLIHSKIETAKKYFFSSNQEKIGDLPTGKYSAEIRFDDNSFKKIDSISIKENQVTYLDFDKATTIQNPTSFHLLPYDSIGFLANSLVCLQGVVIDTNFITLENVKITSQKTGLNFYTNEKGVFSFYGFVNDTLIISYPNYDDKKILISPSGEYHDLFIMLGVEKTDHLSPVIISATRGNSERQSLAYAIQNVTSTQDYGYINGLAGRVAGVQMTNSSGEAGASTSIRIRGAASLAGNENSDNLQEVVVTSFEQNDDRILNSLYGSRSANLDSIKFILQLEGIELNEKTTLETIEKALQNNEKKQNELAILGVFGSKKSLRNNFKDNAIWQPTLRTDKNGKATFEVTYPDNITSWETNVVALNTKRQVGQLQTKTLSYLPLSAQLAVPRFLICGDSIKLIGKVASYLSDSVAVKTSFEINDKTKNVSENLSEKQVLFSSLDSLWTSAISQNDSLKVRYLLESNQSNSIYKDGEERFIPLFEKGIFVNNGFFAILEGDTTLNVQAFKDSLNRNGENKFTITLQENIFEPMLDELKNIQDYAYACNEQKASKIRAYVMEKEILQLLGRKFSNKKQRELTDLIEKLQKAKNKYYTWGWWEDSQPDAKMTNYIATVLAEAHQKGENIDIQILKNTHLILTKNLSSMDSVQQIEAFTTLYKIEQSINSKNNEEQKNELKEKVRLLTDSLLQKEKSISEKIAFLKNGQTSNFKVLSFYNRLQLIRLRQLYGLDYSLEILKENEYKTALGSIFWREKMAYSSYFSSYSIFDNEVQITLLVYQILQKHLEKDSLSENDKNLYSNHLIKIRQYFFERKSRSVYWRNTHESATILSTILPDIISKENDSKKNSLNKNEKIAVSSTLKFDDKIMDTKTVSIQSFSKENLPQKIQKTGLSPVFVSVSEKYFEANPVPNESEKFRIRTFFEGQDNEKTNSDSIFIQTGKQIKLIVEVEILELASYVQIEVPIPASCVYAPSETNFRNRIYYQTETYRENFKEKTSIFCTQMSVGKHRFEVILEPRYQGYFTLNPAKIEMMYFPIFFENTVSKKVIVE